MDEFVFTNFDAGLIEISAFHVVFMKLCWSFL